MAEKCIRCGAAAYEKRDQETDFQGRIFFLWECKECGSMVIRQDGWDPASWKKVD